MANAAPDPSTQIIAEIGSVHDGSFGNALKAIETAAACGADIVKFQTHIAEAETLPNAPMPTYFSGEPRMEYFRRTAFTKLQWQDIARHCSENNVQFLSSPFAIEAVDLLEDVGVNAYKIPSGEVSNIPLLERVASTNKLTYLSSGMSNWAELDEAVAVLRQGGPLVVLQCSSRYPCPADKVGLNVMLEMKRRYGVDVGFSDHTLGVAACVGAAALGAVVVEKHFTFSRHMYGSDAQHSMEPDKFREFAQAVKEMSEIIRNPLDKDDLSDYAEMKHVFEKSIVTARPLDAGTELTRADLAFKKPGDGIPARDYKALLGRRLTNAKPRDAQIDWKDLT